MTLKDITDAEKPWFDYTSYLLRIAAWALAVAYAAHQNFRPQFPGTGPLILEWLRVGMAVVFGLFLVYRFFVMSVKLVKEITVRYLSEETLKNQVLFGAVFIWYVFGAPYLVIAFTGEVIEAYVERIRANPPPCQASGATCPVQADDLPLSPTGPQYTVRPAVPQPGPQHTLRPIPRP